MLRFIRQWWPTAIVVCVILYATLNEDPVGADELPLIPHIDKLIHAVMFGGLFAALCFDYYRAGHALRTRAMLCFAAACVCAGILDEIAQTLMENGRSGEPADFAADCLGIAVAWFTAPPAIRRVLRNR